MSEKLFSIQLHVYDDKIDYTLVKSKDITVSNYEVIGVLGYMKSRLSRMHDDDISKVKVIDFLRNNKCSNPLYKRLEWLHLYHKEHGRVLHVEDIDKGRFYYIPGLRTDGSTKALWKEFKKLRDARD